MKRLLFSVMVLAGFAMQGSAAPKGNPMDTDADGKVSKKEFVDARAKASEKAGKEFDQAVAEKQFTAKDKNGDGFLAGKELQPKPKKAPKAPKAESEAAGSSEE